MENHVSPEPNVVARFRDIPDWTAWEQNQLSQVVTAWTALQVGSPALQRPQSLDEGSAWEYGPEATTFLDALENLFREIDERRRTADIDWSKPFLTQCLFKFESVRSLETEDVWEVLTYLRAATRFSRFPDNNDGGWFASHFVGGGISHAMERLRELAPLAKDQRRQLLPISAEYYDSLASRIPVVRSDWSNEPMGPISAAVRVDIRLSPQAMNVIRLGLLPEKMEDKWFLFFEEPFLHFHRSWTGFEALTMKIEDGPEGHLIGVIQVSQNAESVNYKSGDEGAEVALETLCACLLGFELLLHEANDVVDQWHTFGQQTLGQGPLPGKRPTQVS